MSNSRQRASDGGTIEKPIWLLEVEDLSEKSARIKVLQKDGGTAVFLLARKPLIELNGSSSGSNGNHAAGKVMGEHGEIEKKSGGTT